MKVSVIIPTRHRNDQLSACLDCLALGRQTIAADQYEVIVTDDGRASTAEQMIRSRYPWAQWVAGPRKGPAANRNSGAKHARGQWLAMTDDDCLPSPQWLQSFLSALSPGVDVLEGKTTCQAGIHSPLQEAPINLTGGNLWSCNFMIRAQLFRDIGGFDDSFPMPACEDMELNGRLRKRGHIPQFVPEAIVDHPPRPRPLGWRAGLRWESRVLLWRKEGHATAAWTWMPSQLLRYRAGEIRAHPLGWESVVAAASAMVELCCVVAHLPAWERRYAATQLNNAEPDVAPNSPLPDPAAGSPLR